ncbi:MAG: hypothetical protein IJQ65_06535 [Kiritimatiellae bacterium]|nr:hypothetical protein [Kiritimatiellia bacterium]
MINLTAEAGYGESGTVDALSRLIEQRCKILHETARDAAVATMISAIDHIRAQTRQAKPNAKTKPKIDLRGELVPSAHKTNSTLKKKDGFWGDFCLRNTLGHRVNVSLRVVRLEDKGVPFARQHVFYVRPEHQRDKPYLAVATSRSRVAAYEQRRSAARKRQMGGLARYTLGLAMAKLSTRNKAESVGRGAMAAAPRFVTVTSEVMGENMALEMRDTLDHAIAALRGGPSSVDTALKKAANKIAGRLQHTLNQAGDLSQSVPAPFPELVGKRRSS